MGFTILLAFTLFKTGAVAHSIFHLVTDYFWEQLDMFMDPQAREKQMKMDETVDIIRKRFGFYSVQRGLMYRDRILSACDAKSDHTVHPHGYFG